MLHFILTKPITLIQKLLVTTNMLVWPSAENIFFQKQIKNFISVKTPSPDGEWGNFQPDTQVPVKPLFAQHDQRPGRISTY